MGTRDAGTVRPRLVWDDGAYPARLGMRFSSTFPFQNWLEVGRRVRIHEDASRWWLGDWLNYGKQMYGRRYKRGLELTGLDYQTLRNYAMVARRFEMSRRRDTLSFQHHAELCALSNEAQDRWLDRAEAERWTRNELRRRLREERQPEAAPGPVAVRFSVDGERRERWLAAAVASGVALDVWIVHALDVAAAATPFLGTG